MSGESVNEIAFSTCLSVGALLATSRARAQATHSQKQPRRPHGEITINYLYINTYEHIAILPKTALLKKRVIPGNFV
jgi:hypothetical protein